MDLLHAGPNRINHSSAKTHQVQKGLTIRRVMRTTTPTLAMEVILNLLPLGIYIREVALTTLRHL